MNLLCRLAKKKKKKNYVEKRREWSEVNVEAENWEYVPLNCEWPQRIFKFLTGVSTFQLSLLYILTQYKFI